MGERTLSRACGIWPGGEVYEYTKLLAEVREQAIDRMIAETEALGANGVLAVRFQSVEISRGAAEMMCYGTAVELRADAPPPRVR